MIKTPQILKSLSHALQVTKQFQKTKSLFSPLLEHMTCNDFKKEIATDPIVDSNSCNQISSSKLVFSGLFFFNLLPLRKEEKHISHFFQPVSALHWKSMLFHSNSYIFHLIWPKSSNKNNRKDWMHISNTNPKKHLSTHPDAIYLRNQK